MARCVLAAGLVACGVAAVDAAEPVSRDEVLSAMKRAATYYRETVAAHGGYVYHYSADLQQRWGEGAATPDQIWVQPPGTPTVGMAYLAAWRATQDAYYLEAARAAAHALCFGQLNSGGWTNAIDFAPDGDRRAAYRGGRGKQKGRNYSTLDDGITQSALRFLIQFDQATGRKDAQVGEAVTVGLQALLAAQYPNGGFPQVWSAAVPPQPVLSASYPEYAWKTEHRVKEYWNLYTLNDDLAGDVVDLLIEASVVYKTPRYHEALQKFGDFLILAQMPEPQPGWAQQYTFEMRPAWARKFEPPAVSGRESQDVIAALLKIHAQTGDDKYLKPIPRAVAWLQKSTLPDGRLARFYELQTNRPLYMTKAYELTYDDSDAPSHYGWKTESHVAELELQMVAAAIRQRRKPAPRPADEQVRRIVESLDAQDRWLSVYGGEPLVGQPKLRPQQEYLSSAVFAQNLELLAQAAADEQSRRPAD